VLSPLGGSATVHPGVRASCAHDKQPAETGGERITGCAEPGGVPGAASRSNGQPGSATVQGVPVVAGEMLVRFERVEDDWTERGPAGKRRLTAA
jgi:hypothetical protein